MRRLMNVALAAALLAVTHSAAWAQTKTVEGETRTVEATVEAIDASTRTLTLKTSTGGFVPITVPASMTRFSEIKVGDTVQARYYDNIVLRVKPPGEKAVDTASSGITPGAKPGATAAVQRTITAVITAIDMAIPSVTFKGETVKWAYSSRVNDKEMLAKVKVGDRVDITWTEAAMVSVVPPKK